MEDEEQKERNSKKVKQATKQATGQVAKQLGKKFIKFIIKKHLYKYVIILAVIFLIIIIIASSSWYIHVKDAQFETDSDSPKYSEYCPQEYFENIYVTDEGTLMSAISVEDVWANDKRYKRYLSSVDALAYLLNAQVVSQSPYIDAAASDELNGTIKFFRNDSQIPMSFVQEDVFDGYVSDYNNSGDQDSKNNALNSFTINSNGTIKVAYQQGETESVISFDENYANQMASQLGTKVTKMQKDSSGREKYTVSTNNSHMYTKNISYRKIIENYSLPFELLWAIVVMGDNGSSGAGNSEDFAHALASMAYDSEINLVIDDNSETKKIEEQHSYDIIKYRSYSNILLKYGGHVIGSVPEDKEINEPQSREHVSSLYTKVENNNSPTLRIKKIESWCAVYQGKDSFSTTTTNLPPEVDNSIPITSKWVVENEVEHSSKYSECEKEEIKELLSTSVSNPNDPSYTVSYKEQDRSRRENDKKFTTVTTQTTSSSNATSVTPSYNDDITDLFNVTPFKVVKRYLTKSNYKTFIRVLEHNTTTANMVDLINYIFNQVTDSEKYGKDLDFESIWEKSGFTNATSSSGKSIAGDTIQERVWLELRNEGYSEIAVAAALGNFEEESGFITDAVNQGSGAYGLCQWLGGRKTNLAEFAKRRNKEMSDEDLQIEYLIAELNPNGGAEGLAAYQFAGHEEDREIWENSSSIEDATNAFARGFERPGGTTFPKRVEYAKQYYEKFHGANFSSGGSGTMEESNTPGIRGEYTSSISGRKFTLYTQDDPRSSWYSEDACFICSLCTIMSGFGYEETPNTLTGFSYGSGSYGNQSDFLKVCQYADGVGVNYNDIKKYLQDGEGILFHVLGKTIITDNGSASYGEHWLALLDYKNENGKDKVYVHDPWGGNPSYGWADLNNIVNVITNYYHAWK